MKNKKDSKSNIQNLKPELAPIILFAYNRPWHTRESPSLVLIKLLLSKSAVLEYNDSCIPKTKRHKLVKQSIDLTAENLKKYNCVSISIDHSACDSNFIFENVNLIVDTRNLVKDNSKFGDKVVKA